MYIFLIYFLIKRKRSTRCCCGDSVGVSGLVPFRSPRAGMFRDPGPSLCILSPGRLNQETLVSAQALLAAGRWREIWAKHLCLSGRDKRGRRVVVSVGCLSALLSVWGWNKPCGPVLSLLLLSWLEPGIPSCSSSLTLC